MEITDIAYGDKQFSMTLRFAPLDVDRVVYAVRVLSDGKNPWLNIKGITKLARWNVYDVAFVLRYLEKVGVVESDTERELFRSVPTPLFQG